MYPKNMLDRKYIAIGRLNRLLAINDFVDRSLIASLAPNEVFPFLLWQDVHEVSWKKYLLHNATFHKQNTVVEFPFLCEKSAAIFQKYLDTIIPIFSTLSSNLFMEDFANGINLLAEMLYGNGVFSQKSVLDNLINALWEIEKKYPLDHDPHFSWRVNLSPAQYQKLLREKAHWIASYDFNALYPFFRDAFVVDKVASLNLLSIHGDVPASMIESAEESCTEPEISTQTTNAETDVVTPIPATVDEAPQKKPVLIIPIELWLGKNPTTVRDAMRVAGYSDAVIAYILNHNCKVKKTAIGKLLSDHDVSDAAHRDSAKKLLETAKSFTIQSN